MAAPVGALLWAAAAFTLRISYRWITARVKGQRFDAFDRPVPVHPSFYTGHQNPSEDDQDGITDHEAVTTKGKFF